MRWKDHPKKPVNARHYQHYCAGAYNFTPPGRKQLSDKELQAQAEKAYDNGTMGEKQYRIVREHMGQCLATKYKTCRRAFREYDQDCSGTIDRHEVRKLFEFNGYSETAADRFFNQMDTDRNGTVEFNNFIDVFAPYIQQSDEMKDYKNISTTMKIHYNEAVLQENKSAEDPGELAEAWVYNVEPH